MKAKLTVIKVGGKIVEEETSLQKLLNDFAAIEGPKVLVHGGGRSATKIATQLAKGGDYGLWRFGQQEHCGRPTSQGH